MESQYDQDLLLGLIEECSGHVLFRPYGECSDDRGRVYGNIDFPQAAEKKGTSNLNL